MKLHTFIHVRNSSSQAPHLTLDLLRFSFQSVVTQHFYNSVGPDKERVLLSKFLEAATPFQGVQKDRVIRIISQRYFDHIDMNNATQFVASFINVRLK